MKKTSIILGILTLIAGIVAMTAFYFGFKYLPWRIDGDKMIMCALFELIIAFATLFVSGSFFHDATKNEKRTR